MDKETFKNKIYYLSNNIVLDSKKELKMTEHRIIRLALTDLKPQFRNMKQLYEPDSDFREFSISTESLRELFKNAGEGNNHRLYDNIHEATNNLIKTSIEVGTRESFIVFPLFNYISFDITSGLKLKFHNKLKQLLLNFSDGNYTSYFLKLSFDIKHPRALTLLELMLTDRYKAQKQGLKFIEKEIDIDELKFALGIKGYKGRMNRVREAVIDPIIKEINDKTNYKFLDKYTYTYRGETRKAYYEIKYGERNKMLSMKFALLFPDESNDVLNYQETIDAEPVENTQEEKVAERDADPSTEPKINLLTEPKKKEPAPKADYTTEEKIKIRELQSIGFKRTKAEKILNDYGIIGIDEAIQALKTYKNRLSAKGQKIDNASGFIYRHLKNYVSTLAERETEDIYKSEETETEAEREKRRYKEMVARIQEEDRLKNEQAKKEAESEAENESEEERQARIDRRKKDLENIFGISFS